MSGSAAEVRNVLLLGKTHSGRSSLGNALLGSTSGPFEVSSGMVPTCNPDFVKKGDKTLTVVDSPDILKYRSDPRAYRKLLSKAFDQVSGNKFHAVLILIRIDVRLTKEECCSVIAILNELFGPRLFQSAIVVLTHCDSLLDNGNFEQFLKKLRSDIQFLDQLLTKCGDRYCPVSKDKSDLAAQRQLIAQTSGKDAYTREDFVNSATAEKPKVCDVL